MLLEQSAAARRSVKLDVPTRSGSTLLLISREGPKSITEIAFRLQLSHPFIITLCDRLVEAGLAVSQRDREDGRRRVIALTAKGKQTASKVERFSDALANSFASLFKITGTDLLAALDSFEEASADGAITRHTVEAFARFTEDMEHEK